MVDVQRWSSMGVVEIPINLVLVIDDEADAATFVKQSLEDQHISVRVARDGGQAHASFTMHKPDFVILDLMLPGESGFEICERLKKLDEGVPILVLSAIDMEDSRELAARVGADGYLLKPVSAEHLVKTVRDLAERVWQRTHLEERKTDHERIRFNCGCGKKLKVSALHKGKSMTCPHCGEPLIVPKHSTTA